MVTYILGALAVELGEGRSKRTLALDSLFALQDALGYTIILLAIQLIAGGTEALFNGYLLTSSYVVTLKLLTVISGRVILDSSEAYMRNHSRHLLEYPLVFVLAILFMLLLVGAGHLISAFMALVGFSLNLYVLVLFDAPTAMAREAGIKYFYLSAFSSGLMLYGIFLLFLVTGTGHFSEMGQFLATQPEIFGTGRALLEYGILFLLIGLFFKLSAFPGHLWAAEVYEGSPDPITAVFMLPVKVAVLSFVLQFLTVALEPVCVFWQPLIALSSFFSIIWGCFAALAERKTKRFLAYASINQIGFILLGLAAGSFEGYRTTLLYLFIYAVTNIGFLVVFLNARRADGNSLIYLSDFRGIGQQHWLLSWTLAVTLLSMAGIPPLAGFFGKYYLLLHAQEQGLYGLVITALVTSLVSTYYYLRLIKIFWFEGGASITAVTCNLSESQYVTLFVVEGFLWTFILFAGQLVSFVDLILQSVLISA